jgi:hypothetical protein
LSFGEDLGVLGLAFAQTAFDFDDCHWLSVALLLYEYLWALVLEQVFATLKISSEAAEFHGGAANAWQEGTSFWVGYNLVQAHVIWRQFIIYLLALLFLKSLQLANLII